jgi:hypothetical protein
MGPWRETAQNCVRSNSKFHCHVHYIPSLVTVLSQCNKIFSIASFSSTLTLQLYLCTDLPSSLFSFKFITSAFVLLRIFHLSTVAACLNNSVFFISFLCYYFIVNTNYESFPYSIIFILLFLPLSVRSSSSWIFLSRPQPMFSFL